MGVVREEFKGGESRSQEPGGVGFGASCSLEGSRFYPDTVCTHILELPRFSDGRMQAGGSRERLLMSLQPTAIRFALYQIQRDRGKSHRETFEGAACLCRRANFGRRRAPDGMRSN